MPIRPLLRRTARRQAADDVADRPLTMLYTAHAAAVRRFVAGHVDAHHCEDVVQDTFIRAWKNIDRIDTVNGNPRSFLLTTAHNVMVDHWRARPRRSEVLVDTDVVVPSADTINKSLERLLIGESLQRLSAEHRAVIKALYFDDLTLAETASRLDIAVGTVKSRSYYAVRALRVIFDEMGLL